MAAQAARESGDNSNLVGFATVDDRGRIALSKDARQALSLHAGSSLAYVVVDGAIMLFPQDERLAQLFEHTARVLEGAGLTAEALLEELPAVRDEMMREDYGDEFVDELARRHAALRTAPHESGS